MISRMIKALVYNDSLLRELNKINITIIPKKEILKRVNAYRPITNLYRSYWLTSCI